MLTYSQTYCTQQDYVTHFHQEEAIIQYVGKYKGPDTEILPI